MSRAVWCRCVCALGALSAAAAGSARPNIVIILADDLGFNDVGFHGSNEIPTPNIDALAYSGLILQNYYVTPICTPSRAALMTGKYPIHTGMQHSVIFGTEPRGLPLSEKIMPQYMKELGYKTHLVGKWHLGNYKKEYLPLNRGFDSHLGFWTGKIDLYDHTNMEQGSWGYDFRRGFEVADDLFGQYATDVYTKEAVRLIKAHNSSEPLFLMVCHSAMHSGNPYEFLRAPDDAVHNHSHIQDLQRRKYAAMLTKMDESVGKVVASLQSRGLLENSIIVFSTDNGGPAAGFNDNAASNYPLRGVKNTLWEGGVRGAGLLWSPLLKQRSHAATQRLHLVDWLPSLYHAAGGDASEFKNLDGMNLWDALSKDLPSSRTDIVHNIDDIWNSAGITVGRWKLLKGANYGGAWSSWYGPSGRAGNYNVDLVYRSDAGVALGKVEKLPSQSKITRIREEATVRCNSSIPVTACAPLQAPCLYDVEHDPCERQNLASLFPDILQRMLTQLDNVNKTAVPPNNKDIESRADPKYWGRVFTTFGDFPPIRRSLCLV
ncbi:arylsulfatase I isoform X2 [Anticarsia gemmatalis]|uniref:arylsulfatase I isoform X1 n=1 Tax=Anticarsia gemmatalis TaxID=129554 RepID=UPI003F757F82